MIAAPFSFWFLLISTALAVGLGVFHALESGHRKEIGGYLTGFRPGARRVARFGIMVVATRVAGLYLVGALVLYASQYLVPEQLYSWLNAISGLAIAGIGLLVLLRNFSGVIRQHSHAGGKNHSHWFLLRAPEHAAPDIAGAGESVSLGGSFASGLSSGLARSPATWVVLLAAFSLHRAGLGLFLITAFSFGLALTLFFIGFTVVYSEGSRSHFSLSQPVLRYLPVFSSFLMIILGAGISISGFASSPAASNTISKNKLIPFLSVILLGLLLGMRHSTDPDHVVAVSTIVSRQRSIKHSAVIGLLWGLGHTLTIFLVGSLIIIFGVIIPPRLGLSMEFSVALMLILLGVLNLTGVLRWITERFTPAQTVNAVSQKTSECATLIESTMAKPEVGKTGVGKLGMYQTVRPFAVGLVHGLAGSAAVALLVLSTIRSPVWATAYLLVFGVGTMVGMMLMTTAIAVPLAYTGRKFLKVNRFMTTTSGVLSMAFGLFLVYHIGLVDGLFTAQPHWIPQ